jgi:hypothetical protein
MCRTAVGVKFQNLETSGVLQIQVNKLFFFDLLSWTESYKSVLLVLVWILSFIWILTNGTLQLP